MEKPKTDASTILLTILFLICLAIFALYHILAHNYIWCLILGFVALVLAWAALAAAWDFTKIILKKMAVKDWHWGQLIVFWVATLLVVFVLGPIGELLGETFLFSGPAPFQKVMGFFLAGGILITYVSGVVSLLVVTWIWFGGRAKTRHMA